MSSGIRAYRMTIILMLYTALVELGSGLSDGYVPAWVHFFYAGIMFGAIATIGVISWIRSIRAYNEGD